MTGAARVHTYSTIQIQLDTIFTHTAAMFEFNVEKSELGLKMTNQNSLFHLDNKLINPT
jgi:hypothetical protein